MYKTIFSICILVIGFLVFGISQGVHNYYEHTNFIKYAPDNERVMSENNNNRVVFMGNSITEVWPNASPEFFANPDYIGRGISGQTTPQMLLRFRKDVIELQPEVVVILAGINDIAGNSGFTPISTIAENIMSMSELAKENNIEVILCSVLPAIDFPWSPGLEPVNKVIELNGIIEDYAGERGIIYVDYHTAMKDDQNGLRVPEYTTPDDLVHPNKAGYAVMESLIQPAINKARSKRSLTVHKLFSDHMVLQRNEQVKIWGRSIPGSKIDITASWGSRANTITNQKGDWTTMIQTPEAGGPYQLYVDSEKHSIEINDIMIGEVWLASGQSNMAMDFLGWPPTDMIDNFEKEIKDAQHPMIRMFKVDPQYSMKERINVEGDWKVCSRKNVVDFSAAAYFFARRLNKELKVPIGIINSTWGGTPAESWVSRSGIKELGDFEEVLKLIDDPEREKNNDKWFSQFKKIKYPKKSIGWNEMDFDDHHMSLEDFDDSNWDTYAIPGRIDFRNEMDCNGVFWFRKTIDILDPKIQYTFKMGTVDDTDAVYVNGKKIGGTVNNYTDGRVYDIPNGLLKKGENIIALRIIDTGGPGYVNGDVYVESKMGKKISLHGDWKSAFIAEFFDGYVYVYDMDNLDLNARPNILSPSPYSTPTSLYNAMIIPLVPYKIKGAIWYQGESNVGRAEQYERLFPALIKDWRKQWESEFSFYFVQIAPYVYNQNEDRSADVSQELRDAQRKTLSLDKTGMVVTMDIGNTTNIHPGNKQDVGSRLAGLALSNDYGKRIISSGPLYKNHEIKKNKIIVNFDFTGTGLMFKNGRATGFEIAGADKEFVNATVKIKNDKLELSAANLKKPKYVRYAWNDRAEASLFNIEGLPASSFEGI